MKLNNGPSHSSSPTASGNRPKMRSPRRLRFRTAAAVGVVLTASALAPATKADTVTWTGFGDGINWSNINNWSDTTTSSPKVPTAADNVLNATSEGITLNSLVTTINSFSSTTGGQFLLQSSTLMANVPGTSTLDNSGGVYLNGSTLSGFIVGSGTTISVANNTNNLVGVTINGILDEATTSSQVYTSGGLVLNGTAKINNNSILQASDGDVYSGTGSIVFGNSTDNRLNVTGTLTLSGVTVDGINGNLSGNFINSGLISSDGGGVFNFNNNSVTNNTKINATNSSTINFNSNSITGGQINADAGSTVYSNGTEYNSLSLTGAGHFTFANNTNELNNSTVNGVTLDLATTSSQLYVTGGLVLNGSTVNIDQNSILQTNTNAQSISTNSTGFINFGSATDNRLDAAGGPITIDSGVTIQGINGNFIGDFVNSGSINSNGGGLFSFGAYNVTNNTTINATNSSNITFASTVVTGGTLNADAGSGIYSNGAAYNDLSLTGAGHFTFANNTNELNNSTVNGVTLDLASASSQLYVTGGLVLNGSTVNIDQNSILQTNTNAQSISTNSTGFINFGSATNNRLDAAGGPITIDSGVTIQGINGNFIGDFVNSGSINSNGGGLFSFGAYNVTNNTTINATNSSNITFASTVVTGGTLNADAGSGIYSNGAAYNDLSLTGAGHFTFANNTNELNNSTVNGVTLDLASASSQLYVTGGLVLNGSTVNIDQNSILQTNTNAQSISTNSTGFINFGTSTNNRLDAAGGPITIDSGVTIQGVNGNFIGDFVNSGSINSNGGGLFSFGANNVTNNTTINATNSSNITFASTVVTGGTLNADAGSGIYSDGAEYNDLSLTGAGHFTFANNTNELNNSTVNGVTLDLASASSQLYVTGGLVLNGSTVNIDQNSILQTNTNAQSISTNSTGFINFGSSTNNRLDAAGGAITIDSGVTIQGVNGKFIGDFVNSGYINSNGGGMFTFGAYNVTNNTTINATNSGNITFGSSVVTGGTLNADAGSYIYSDGSTYNNVNLTGGGVFQFANNTNNINSSGGPISTLATGARIDLASTTSQLYTSGGLKIDGTVSIDNNSILGALGDQTYSGSGKIVFGSSTDNRLDVGTGTLTLGPNLTVEGRNGTIQGNALVNNGTIAANVAGGTLAITTTSFTNNGLLQAINGGSIVVTPDILNYGTVNINAGGFAPASNMPPSLTVGSGRGLLDVEGGTLTGGGTISGNVTIGTGGTISPGDPQSMTIIGNYIQNGTFKDEIAGNGLGLAGNNPNGYDQVNVTGSATLTNPIFDVDPLNPTTLEAELAANHPLTFDILNAAGGIDLVNGPNSYTIALDPSLVGWSITGDTFTILNGTEGILTIDGLVGPATPPVGGTSTPEPGAMGLFAGLMTSGAFFYRRRRRN